MTAAAAISAATVTVDLGASPGVKLVGAIARWDNDGNPRRLPDQKAKIDAPYLDATAVDDGNNQLVFKDLAPGKYDLLILGQRRLRIEGFQYVPVKEFDPFFPPDTKIDEDAREFILGDIKGSQHYENKVVPLYLSGQQKAVRILVMLIRDLPTSFQKGAGTIRHEIWQYNWNYGGWQKDKRTKVLDRILLDVSELRQWTWLWDPKLGGIDVGKSPLVIHYELPRQSAEQTLKGLYPY